MTELLEADRHKREQEPSDESSPKVLGPVMDEQEHRYSRESKREEKDHIIGQDRIPRGVCWRENREDSQQMLG
jgi:hypothetical protein